MTLTSQVTVINVDKKGNYWKEALPINDALLRMLRFARQNPQATCTIELRAVAPTEQLQRLSEVSMEMHNRDQMMQRHLQQLRAEQGNSDAGAQDLVARLKRPSMFVETEVPQAAVNQFAGSVSQSG